MGTSYQLRNDDGDIAIGSPVAGTGGTIQLPTGTITVNTTFNVLAITANSCTKEMGNTVSVNVQAPPTANSAGFLPLCDNAQYMLQTPGDATATNYTTLSWTEDGAGSITAGGTTLTPTYTPAPGDDNNIVSLTLTASNGICPDVTSVNSFQILVIQSPAISLNQSYMCVGSISSTVLSPLSADTMNVAKWESSDPTIAFVRGDGVVTALQPGTVTFTYNDFIGGCSSTTSTLTVDGSCQVVTLTQPDESTLPTVSITGAFQTVCPSNDPQATFVGYTAATNSPISYSIDWDNTANGAGLDDQPSTPFTFDENGGTLDGIIVTAGALGGATYNGMMTVTNANGCTTTQAVTLTINAAPDAPTSGGDQTECEQSPIQTLTATATAPTGSSVVWYDAATGGNPVADPSLSATGNVTYYAASKDDNTGCESLTRTAVTLTINAAPDAPTSGGDQTECEQSPIQTLTATATAPNGSSVVWYDAATGGNPVADPSLSATGNVTYYAASKDDNTGCESLTRTAVTLTINAAPDAPTSGGDQTECEQSPIQTLTATATAPNGSSVVWYDAATGGNPVADPSLSATGNVTYYAASKDDNTDCESLTRTAVTLTINAAPDAPTSGGDQTECEQSPIQTLTATATAPNGSSVVWYDAATGGNPVADPSLSATGTVTYWAASKDDNTGCESLTRTAVTLTINAAPDAPTATTPQTACEDGNANQTITAVATAPTGSSVVWYDAATDGNVVANPTQVGVGSVTYYAASKDDNTGCESLTRTAVTLTITAAPDAPTSGGDQTECEQSPIQTLTATATAPNGSSVVWYDAATDGNIVADPSLNATGTVTYWAASKDDNTGCESLTRTAVTLTINAAPDAPSSGEDQTECEQSPIQTLTATATAPNGSSVVWYDAATGGNPVADPSLSATGNVTYYAASKDDNTGCESLTRTAVTLTINAAPDAPTSGGDQTECEQSPIQTLTATATAPTGSSVVWYDAATGGNPVADPSLSATGTVTYWAASKDDNTGCESLTRTAVTLTINAAPDAPTSGGDQTECEQSPIQTLTATATAPTGSSVVWYDAATGGNPVADPSLSATGTVTYWAASKDDNTGCESMTRTAVTLTITAGPDAPTATTPQTACEDGNANQTITAVATAPNRIERGLVRCSNRW